MTQRQHVITAAELRERVRRNKHEQTGKCADTTAADAEWHWQVKSAAPSQKKLKLTCARDHSEVHFVVRILCACQR
jgi:hypothetical protein